MKTLSGKRIVKWVTYSEAENYPRGDSLEHYEAFQREIVKNRYWWTGEAAQESGEACVPVFDDGTACVTTWRALGFIMADAWNEIIGKKEFDYMDFYLNTRWFEVSGVSMKFPQTEVRSNENQYN